MAKKYKRTYTKPVTRSEPTPDAAAEGDAVPVVQTPRIVSSRQTLSSEFNPDYSYVIKDLRTIGTLAVSFFAILILLSFFL